MLLMTGFVVQDHICMCNEEDNVSSGQQRSACLPLSLTTLLSLRGSFSCISIYDIFSVFFTKLIMCMSNWQVAKQIVDFRL